MPARTQVQVWQDGSVTLLHRVTISADTPAGVPFTKPPTRDSCRVRMALGRVDSLRTGSKERGFFRTAGLVLAISAVGAYLFSGVGGD